MGKLIATLLPGLAPELQAALVSTVVESSHTQKYFAEHLPSLTEVARAKAIVVCPEGQASRPENGLNW